jgi:osmotically-inducible protein OsmY
MPNNENDWNRNREGSVRDWNDNDRYSRDRSNEYNDDGNRSQRNYGNQGSYGNSGYTGSRGEGYNEVRRGYGYNDPGNMGDSDYNGDRGRYGSSWGMNRGSGHTGSGESDWNSRGERRYAGNDYGNYSDRYGDRLNRENDRNWWDKTKDEVSSWFGDDDAERRRRMDERQGNYRGKGPKGYTRSDDRIKEDVNDALSDDPNVDASEIDVSVNACDVTIRGTVNSRWEKRRAEDIAEAVSGVKNVENRLKVTSSTTGTNWGDQATNSMNAGITGSKTQTNT